MKKILLFSLCLPTVCPQQIVAENKTDRRPNLLIVMADQFRGDAFSFRGKEAVIAATRYLRRHEACFFRELIRTATVC